jgi:hypothetical protein
VHARGDHHPELRAGVDIDVRVDAALADQPQLRQSTEERRADLGALANEHQRFGFAQSFGERVDVLDVIAPDLDLVPRQLREAVERAQRVVVVVEDRDPHRGRSSAWPPSAVPPLLASSTSAWEWGLGPVHSGRSRI